jgi:GR25 family glycosyltransferase involved in LPS biosynthesis
MEYKIQTFIFNEKNQTEKTLKLEKQINEIFLVSNEEQKLLKQFDSFKDNIKKYELFVINSDSENRFDHWINIGEDTHFNDRFFKAVDLFDGDVFFYIDCDSICNDWTNLIKNLEKFHKQNNCGIYSPNIIPTQYHSSKNDIKEFLINSNTQIVSTIDKNCWSADKTIIDEFDKYCRPFLRENKHGICINLLLSSISHFKNKPVIRDYNFTVNSNVDLNSNTSILGTLYINELDTRIQNIFLATTKIKEVSFDFKQNFLDEIGMYQFDKTQINTPVYCINLKRAKERKKYITEEWIIKRNVPVTFFEGIDCEDIDESNYDQIPEPFRQNLINANANKYQRSNLGFDHDELKMGEICCSISHCLLLKELINLGVDEAIIIEDDAEPLFENITDLYRRINKFKIDMNGINVMLLHEPRKSDFSINEDRQDFCIPNDLIYCTQCIYYTRQGMIDCYEHASKLILPMDWTWVFGFIENKQIGLIKNPITEHNIMTTYVNSDNQYRLYIHKNKCIIDERFKKFRKKYDKKKHPFYNEGLFLEEYFYNFYQKNKNKFDEIGYTYLPIFWTDTYLLNSDNNQKIYKLDESLRNFRKINPSEKYFVVCQHDDAPRESLPSNTVLFCAGGNIKNSIPIPLISEAKIENEITYEKDIFCSFVGSITHPCRDKIYEIFSERGDYRIITKKWSKEISDKEKNLFINITKRSKYTLCPRGYGPTSWRLYEAMQLGSVPVYIYDEPHLPYKDQIDWEKICVMIHINDIQNIDKILKSIPDHVYNEMITNIQKIYPLYFNLEYMCQYILNNLTSNNTLNNIQINDFIDPQTDPQIDAFIFNWKGQLQKTLKTESELCKIFDKVTVINSDDGNKFDHWINIGEDAYFSAQFLKALELFDGDILFHVQGDVTYDNWSSIIEDAKLYYKKYKYGIYSPNVDYTHWDSTRVDIDSFGEMDNEKLKLVSMTDCSCWFINKEIINEYKIKYSDSFKKNKYGFGADLINCAISFKKNMPVLRDYKYTVDHPESTNYSSKDARIMLEEYIETIKDEELKFLIKKIRNCEIYELKGYLNSNIKYSEIINSHVGDHYNGWAYIINKLKSNINLDDDGIILDGFADNCLWEKEKKTIQKPWIGIVHACEISPTDKNQTCIDAFINNNWFIQSSPFCIALITLSSHHAKILQKKVNVPVFNTTHPKETSQTFDIDSYFENPSIMHSGFFNRNYSNLARFKTSIQKNININKIWYIESMNDCFKLNDVDGNDINSLCINNVFLNDEDYIKNLCKNIGFCYFYDAAANNSVLEHIMSNTPIIANKIPSTIEYLGEEYPMFYENIKDNPDKYLLDRKYIQKVSDYLKNRSNNDIFKINHFINFMRTLKI